MPANRPRTKDQKVRKYIKRLALLMMAGCIGSAALFSGRADTVSTEDKEKYQMKKRNGRTVMYIMDNASMGLRDEDAENLDQLNYSFAMIRNGRADGSHWLGTKQVSSFLRRHPHIDGVLSVGGWGADGFSDACQTEEGRDILADSILLLMDEHGFVGVDIDWEYPGVPGTGIVSREDDVENWYKLLALLRKGLDERERQHGREYILSVALGAGENHLKVLDPARLNELIDQAVVMAYDLSGFDRITGHHAGLYPAADKPSTGAYAVKQLMDGGLEPGRILLGMPAYGRVWRQVTGSGTGLNQRAGTSGNKTISFDELLRLGDQGYSRHYDKEAQATYWYDGSTYVSGEDDRSIQYKCRWILEKGLQGAAVWQYTQDASGAMLAMMNASLTE